eukprot:scaffold8150_cov118-Cylindrotheca_fusiformis.AAC.11
MKTVFNVVFLFLGVLTVFVNGQPYNEGRRPWSSSRPQSCEEIIEKSKFYGTCCSLNTTASNAGLSFFQALNIPSSSNVWQITGEIWTETWNSTDDRIECDGSEHDVPILTTGSGFQGGGDSAACSRFFNLVFIVREAWHLLLVVSSFKTVGDTKLDLQMRSGNHVENVQKKRKHSLRLGTATPYFHIENYGGDSLEANETID